MGYFLLYRMGTRALLHPFGMGRPVDFGDCGAPSGGPQNYEDLLRDTLLSSAGLASLPGYVDARREEEELGTSLEVTGGHLDSSLSMSLLERLAFTYRRRRIYTKEKAKVVAAVWGTELIQFLAMLTRIGRIYTFLDIILVQFILFFISS